MSALLGRQDGHGVKGTVYLAGAAADALFQVHGIQAVRLQNDAVHHAEHGAVAAAGAADGVDDGAAEALASEGMRGIVHKGTPAFKGFYIV